MLRDLWGKGIFETNDTLIKRHKGSRSESGCYWSRRVKTFQKLPASELISTGIMVEVEQEP